MSRILLECLISTGNTDSYARNYVRKYDVTKENGKEIITKISGLDVKFEILDYGTGNIVTCDVYSENLIQDDSRKFTLVMK